MDEQLRKSFSANLKKALRNEGKTQSDMAKYMKISTATASDWCNGNKMPRADKLQSLCNWLHIGLQDLLVNFAPSVSGHTDGYMMVRTFTSGLTDDEQELIDNYRLLNDEAKAFIADNARNFASMDKYKKAGSAAETA